MEIRNLKEWCTALDEQAKNVEIYEKTLLGFYKNIKVNPDYDTPFMTGCYNKEKFSKNIVKIIFSCFLPVLVISAVICLISWVLLVLKNPGELLDKVKDYGVQSIKTAAIITIIAFIVILALSVVLKFLSYKGQIKRLSTLENNLKGFMTTVPMSYRTSEKMKTIAKVYFTKPTINPSIILDVCDDYLRQAGYQCVFTSVMFDLPSNCPFLNMDDSKANAGGTPPLDTDSPISKKSEFLPSDIDTKVFEGSKDSNKDLQAMIGLESVKDQVEKFKNRISFYGKESNNGCHMAFLGSAGTGKTTVARIVTKMLFDLGIIKKNQYIEISGDYLVAGNTSRASAIIEYSYGGVLFIDEAYLMYKTGSEVIGVLLKAMEDHRKDFVVILAGYEEQMTKLFASNEGFSSRVKHSIYFPDYTVDEMLEIFNYFIRNYNGSAYKLSDNAKDLLLEAFTLEKRAKSFGNARTVRNAVDTIMDYYADRSIKEKSNTHIIEEPDVQLYYNDRKNALQHEIKNASAADQLDEQIIRLSELKPRMKNGSEDPNKDLSNLIGLESFRQEIELLKNQKEFYGQVPHQKILLIGDDGCGKSSITKILTGYLYQMGFIQDNKYLEIPAELLKGSYVGHTAKRAEAIISYASGGVLYVKNYNTLVNSQDSYAGEALSALTTAINENTDVTIVLADYQSPNIDNIRSLFTIVYEFPVYDQNQMLQIFDLQAMKQGFTVDVDARQMVYNFICQNNVKIRDIQQIFNNSVKQHINNFNGDESTKYLLSTNDIVLPQVNTVTIPVQPQTIEMSVNVDDNSIQASTGTHKIKLKIKPKQ